MPRFDAELYLRLVGEEMLLRDGDRRHRPWDSPLTEAASALRAVGAISAAKARAVIDDYSLAESLRGENALQDRLARARGPRSGVRRAQPLKPRRTVRCDCVIENAHGTVHVRYVTLAEDSTAIGVIWRPPASRLRSSRRGRMAMYGGGGGGPPQPTLVDDRGTTTTTRFSGGGSDQEWEGQLTSDQPLAPDTAWIELDGTRIELGDELSPCEVSIEPLPEQAPASRYLWRRLAVPNHFHQPPDTVEPSIDALVAAGALEEEDDVISEVRAVLEAMHQGMSSGARGLRGLPQPWRSLLTRQSRADGPEGVVVLSAVTPLFDGFSVAASILESRPEGFEMKVEVAPGLEGHRPFSSTAEPRQLAWWASDDKGNHYLGHLGSWSSGEDYSSGDINFWPALDPKADRLQIIPTGETARAVISAPLTWAAERSATQGDSA